MGVEVKVRAIAGNIDGDYSREDFHGVICDEVFSEYLPEGLKDVFKGGKMSFIWELGELWVETDYTSEQTPSEREIIKLAEFTQGQWSDGIGENFEQMPCLDSGYVSPWYRGQQVQIFVTVK